jgi:hypothetical protein
MKITLPPTARSAAHEAQHKDVDEGDTVVDRQSGPQWDHPEHDDVADDPDLWPEGEGGRRGEGGGGLSRGGP